MLEIKNVSKSFGKKKVLDNICLKVGDMSIHGLVGYNGAGKTTLFKIITDVYSRDGGEVYLKGEDVHDNEGAKSRIFYVPDDLFFMTGASMKKMAAFYKGYYPRFDMKTFERLAEMFSLDINAKVGGFSKGMQRQTEIILALAAKPDLILLDESFDGLDPAKRNLMKKLLTEFIAETNSSVVISSHNLKELADMCDHIALMNGNAISLDISVDDMAEKKFKVRLAFKDEVGDEVLEACGLTKISRDGKIISAKLNGDVEECERKIEVLSPLLFDKIPLTLEEVFLEEMEDRDYDFKELFS